MFIHASPTIEEQIGDDYAGMRKTNVTNRGFTLIEMLIVLFLLAILSGVSGSLFVVALRAWDSGCIRTGIREDVSYAMEKTVRDLKEMAQGSLHKYNSGSGEIEHTIRYEDLSDPPKEYVLYLYNADDTTLDDTYGEDLYDLRKADMAVDTPATGDGVLILRDLVSPDATAPATRLIFNPSITQITLDLVAQRYDETIRIRTNVRPRNL